MFDLFVLSTLKQLSLWLFNYNILKLAVREGFTWDLRRGGIGSGISVILYKAAQSKHKDEAKAYRAK